MTKDDLQKLFNSIGLEIVELKIYAKSNVVSSDDKLFKIIYPKFNGNDIASKIGNADELIEYLQKTKIISCYAKHSSYDRSYDCYSLLYNPFYGNTIEQMKIKADLI